MDPLTRRTLAASGILLTGLLRPVTPAVAAPGPLAPAQVQWISAPPEVMNDAPPPLARMPAVQDEGATPAPVLGIAATAAYPTYAWPLGRQMHDGLVVVHYVDLDPSTGILDYSGGAATYDGHNGTDFHLLNFRMMDRGCTIRAAAPGKVIQVSGPAAFDRNCEFLWPVAVNSLTIDTGGGTYTDYYHLRANSMTVQVGDVVQTGQMLGLVGSSGRANGPHLHIQAWDNIGGQSHVRDPYHGPSNPLPSLWIVQEDYDGDNPLWFTDLGVFSEAEVGGNVNNATYCAVIERLQQPVVYGIREAKLPVFVQYQSRVGDAGRIEVLRPNGSLFGSYDFTVTVGQQLGWFCPSWAWNGNVTAADYGTWTVRALSNGVLSYSTTFQVGPATVFGPRFWRRGGRSFRINGAVQRDTLRHSPLGGPVTYSLLNAPSFVSLIQDSIITVGATSNQAGRSLFFQAVMTDGAARQDTAWFHVVDMSKAVGTPVDAGPFMTPVGVELALAGPSPFGDGTALRYHLDAPSRVWLGIYDLSGRLVRMLADGEETAAGESVTRRWDGRDRAGAASPGGVYFARLDAGGARRVIKIARLP
jgi:murein DD-endopeptidase MepM/ murein hydrolase activator NlpD